MLSLRYYLDNQKELGYFLKPELRKEIESYLLDHKHLETLQGDTRSISCVLRWIIYNEIWG